MGFDEVCRRAGGRRAYNRKRRLARARRISAIIALQALGVVKGRKVAALLGVHEGTVSRDLKFVRRVRGEYRQMIGYEMLPQSFRWIADGRGYEITFHYEEGMRLQ